MFGSPRSVASLASLALLTVLAGVGCHRSSGDPRGSESGTAGASTVAGAVAHSAAAPLAPIVPLERERSLRESGGLVLARAAGASLAFVADEDDQAIVEVDVGSDPPKIVRTTPIGSRPRDLLVLADGAIAATLPDANAVAVFGRDGSGKLRELRRATVPNEPIAMGLASDDRALYVSTGASHALVRLGAASLEEQKRWSLGREPRAVLVSQDGKRVFVTHASESGVSVVATDAVEGAPAITTTEIGNGLSCPTGGACNPKRFARYAQAAVRIGERGIVVPVAEVLPNPPTFDGSSPPFPMKPKKAMAPIALGAAASDDDFPLPAKPQFGGSMGGSRGYGLGDGSSGPPMFMDVATIDETDAKRVGDGGAFVTNGTSCLEPRAAIAVKDRIVVACFGSGSLDQLDNPHGQHASTRFSASSAVPTGPTALAATRDEAVVWAWSMLARKVTRFETDLVLKRLPSKEVRPETKALAPKPSFELGVPRVVAKDEAWLRGRELFFGNGNREVSGDGRTCASCHIDGRDDGLTWETPKGKRRTRTLAGQLTTAPYGWLGEHATLEEHVAITFKQLGGKGLHGDQLGDLLTYVRALPKPAVPVTPDPSVPQSGRMIFARAECDSCHTSGGSDRVVHDVGTGSSFMTPTLTGIGSRKQLMHDGRFASLDDLIARSTSMGAGSSLSPDDRQKLVSYLETL